MSASWADVARICATKIVPVGLTIGVGMETFMYFTGEAWKRDAWARWARSSHNDLPSPPHHPHSLLFAGFYNTATRKASERRDEELDERKRLVESVARRRAQLFGGDGGGGGGGAAAAAAGTVTGSPTPPPQPLR
jgi:hypothetical protein